MVFLIICAIWITGEVILLASKRSVKITGGEKDKTLRSIWLIILPSVFIGVMLGVKGLGMIKRYALITHWIGVAMILMGIIIRWWSIFTLKKYFTVDVKVEPDQPLITTGVYSLVRHPAYFGSLLSFAGLGMSFSNPLSLLITTLPIFIIFMKRIKFEEKILLKHYGKAYEEYMHRTSCLLPFIF